MDATASRRGGSRCDPVKNNCETPRDKRVVSQGVFCLIRSGKREHHGTSPWLLRTDDRRIAYALTCGGEI